MLTLTTLDEAATVLTRLLLMFSTTLPLMRAKAFKETLCLSPRLPMASATLAGAPKSVIDPAIAC